MKELVFLKLGGSVITDKSREYTADIKTIDRIAGEIKKAITRNADLSILIGHGSGSFGHTAANKFKTRDGVFTDSDWLGFAEVWQKAHELNQIVLDRLVRAGLPALGFSPCSSIETENRTICSWNTSPIKTCIQNQLIPVIYGDVVFDKTLGGTILSTEDLFEYLVPVLHPHRILLAGIETGVWKDPIKKLSLVKSITPTGYHSIESSIRSSAQIDVTGGMRSKVDLMVTLVSKNPGLSVQIFSAAEENYIYKTLLKESLGTIIENK
jgi:isopentenyl phosphate kinase